MAKLSPLKPYLDKQGPPAHAIGRALALASLGLTMPMIVMAQNTGSAQNIGPAQNIGGQDPLAQLRPPQLPAEPSSFAPGWLWLALLCAILIGFGLYIWRRHRRSASYQIRQQNQWALAELDRLPQDPPAAFIHEANALLKRVAVSHFPAQHPASLCDDDWLQFLSTHCPELDQQALQLLRQGPYLPPEQLQKTNMQPLYQACRLWISKHQRPNHA